MLTSIFDTQRPKVTSAVDQSAAAGIKPIQQTPTASALPAPIPMAENSQPGGLGQLANQFGGALNGAAGLLRSIIPRSDEFNNADYTDKAAAGDAVRNQALTQVKDSIAPAFGPLGMAINSASKVGGAIGDAIGGDGGTVVSSLFAPDEAILGTLNDPDLSVGDKIAGTILPFYGALKSKKAKQARKRSFESNKRIGERIAEQARSEADQRMEDGLQQVENLKALTSQQMGLLKSNF